MTRPPQHDVRARTPSSAMLVQMLFVMSAIGTGAVAALVTWMGPKRADDPPKPDAKETTRHE